MGTRYLIKVDGIIAGYDNISLLRIDIITNKPSHFEIYERTDDLQLRYVPVEGENLKKLLNPEKTA
jgi:hypothetical protein